MKRLLVFALAVCCIAVSTATAQVAVTFSTSSTNASEGTELNLLDGQAGSLFVFAQNDDISGNDVDGLALDVLGTGSSTLTDSDFIIENPGGIRWLLGTSPGTLGDSPGLLVDDSNAAGFILSPANGIQNGVGPVLFATLNFFAIGEGSNTLTFAEGDLEISVEGQAPASLNFGSATVNVSSVAVPEPSSLALLGLLGGASLLRRRRRA